MDDVQSKSLRLPSQASTVNESRSGANTQVDKGEGSSRASRKSNSAKGKSGRSRRRDRHGRKNDDIGVKLVLRLLPPDLSQDQFLEAIKPEVGGFADGGVLEWYYVKGYYPQKLGMKPVYSRCYFIFGSTEQLQRFANKVRPIKFIDDKDNATNAVMKVSSFVRRFAPNDVGSSRANPPLEGTITEDPLFKTFMKSLKVLEEKKSDYSFAEVSILKPLEKEIAKQKAVENEVQRKTENALVALTGDSGKKKKDKKKKKKKNAKAKETTVSETKASRKRKSTKKKSKAVRKAEGSEKDSGTNNNVVILEAAGRKELQRRKKLQMEKEKALGNLLKPKAESKLRPKGRSEDSKKPTLEESTFKSKKPKNKIPE